jgi:hypothetical protein
VATETKLRRQPLAFGITKWGPLPDTEDMHIMWDGPGCGLFLYPRDPERRGSLGMRIRHESAGGKYQTVREAERAVKAFVAAGLAS